MQYIFLINIRIHFKSADHEGSPQISGLAGCEVNYPALADGFPLQGPALPKGGGPHRL